MSGLILGTGGARCDERLRMRCAPTHLLARGGGARALRRGGAALVYTSRGATGLSYEAHERLP